MGKLRVSLMSLAALVALSACGDQDAAPNLMNLRNTDRTPDEFSILPTTPLLQPETFAELPVPTPGGVNRTDPTPAADAVAALGGRVDAGVAGDRGLIATVTRYGVGSDIRATLATEDEAFRRANDGLTLERLFNVNVYYKSSAPVAGQVPRTATFA